MRIRKLIIIVLLAFVALVARAENAPTAVSPVMDQQLQMLEQSAAKLSDKLDVAQKKITALEAEIKTLGVNESELTQRVDSLQRGLAQVNGQQSADRESLTQSIQDAQGSITTTNQMVSARTLWGIVIMGLIVAIVGVVVALIVKRIRRSTSSIDQVRDAQEALEKAQMRLYEESVALDSKLTDIINAQLESGGMITSTGQQTNEIDHSLALKVADEIVRIESNLSRMDSSVKGYKQLSQGVKRIKDNFMANGYEIIDMVGMPYNAGMKVVADFVTNESLAEGEQIITKVTKPQVLYNGKMIQVAQITVSQNI